MKYLIFLFLIPFMFSAAGLLFSITGFIILSYLERTLYIGNQTLLPEDGNLTTPFTSLNSCLFYINETLGTKENCTIVILSEISSLQFFGAYTFSQTVITITYIDRNIHIFLANFLYRSQNTNRFSTIIIDNLTIDVSSSELKFENVTIIIESFKGDSEVVPVVNVVNAALYLIHVNIYFSFTNSYKNNIYYYLFYAADYTGTPSVFSFIHVNFANLEQSNSFVPFLMATRNDIYLTNFTYNDYSISTLLSENGFFQIQNSNFTMSQAIFINTNISLLLSAQSSVVVLTDLLFENVTIYFSTLPFIYILMQSDEKFYQFNFTNSIFKSLNLGNMDSGSNIFINLNFNSETSVTFSNLSFFDVNFNQTALIETNLADSINISNIIISNSTFLHGFLLISSNTVIIQQAIFDRNNLNTSFNISRQSQAALHLQDISEIVISNCLISYSQSHSSSTGIKFYFPNSNQNLENVTVLIDNVTFLGNIAFYEDTIIQGGCAIYISSTIFANITITNSLFTNNSLFMAPSNGIDIIGGAAIRSEGLEEVLFLINCDFKNQTSTHLSSVLWFEGKSLTIINSNFVENSLRVLDQSDNWNGLGTISFYGGNLTILSSIFRKNVNTEGGAVLIDGSTGLKTVFVNISDVFMEQNNAFIHGAGLIFGAGLWAIKANLTNISCLQNNASGGCIFVDFQKTDCYLSIIGSHIKENSARLGGGAIFLRNSEGYIEFIDNFFESNTLEFSIVSGGGGAIGASLSINPVIVLTNNTFFNNSATLAGAFGAFSGQIVDNQSKYLKNFAQENACNFFQFLSNVTIDFAFFADNWSENVALISVTANCEFYLLNSFFQNSSTKSGGINLMNSITGAIKNITFVDQISVLGPCISLVSISNQILIENISFATSVNMSFEGKVIGFWSASALISGFEAHGINGKGFFDIQFNSMVDFHGITLRNITCTSSSKGCIFLEDSNSVVNISSMSLYGVKTLYSLFYVGNSTLTLEGFIFTIIMIDSQTFDKYLLWFEASNISIIGFESKYICGKMFYSSSGYTNLTNGIINNQDMLNYIDQSYYEDSFGNALFFYNQDVTSLLRNVSFIENTRFDYGVIYIQEQKGKIQLINCNFFYNQAHWGGGVYAWIVPKGIFFKNCSFLGNIASYAAGALYFYQPANFEVQSEITECSFKDNEAGTSGGAIFIEANLPMLENNIFERNKANYGPDLASYAIRLALTIYSSNNASNKTLYSSKKENSSIYVIKKQHPGIYMSIVLKFETLDHFGQTTNLLQNEVFYMNVTGISKQLSPKFLGETSANAINGTVYFQNFSLSGLPSIKYYLYVTGPSLKVESTMKVLPSELVTANAYFYIIPIILDSCPEGSVRDTAQGTVLCQTCDLEKFTLSMYQSCQECTDGGQCKDGIISAKIGYWRNQSNSSTFFKCDPFPDSCLGGVDSECMIGYMGPICQSCNNLNGKLYSKSAYGDTCEECYSKETLIILCLFLFAFFLLFLFLFLRSNLQVLFISNSNDIPSQPLIKECLSSTYLKIFLNYLQMLSISKMLDLNWERSLITFFQVSDSVSGSFIKVMNLECLFGDLLDFPMVYFQALITSFLPFFLLILIVFFWVIYAKVKRKKMEDVKEKLISTFIITIFSLQPIIINYLFSMISCRSLDKKYLQTSLTIECFTPNHNSWILKLFIPSFCFFGFFLPLVAFSYMRMYATELHLIMHIKRIGFLSNGYRRKKFYWEFLFFYRKMLLIFIAQFFSYEVGAKTLLVLLILFVSLWFQSRDNPFITEDLNSLDFKATMFSFCTLFSGLFSYDFETTVIKIGFMLLIFFLNFFFIVIWIRRMLVLNVDLFSKPLAKKYLFWCLPYIEKLRPEYQALEIEASNTLAYFTRRKNIEKDKKPRKPSVFKNFRSALSKMTAPDCEKKSINLSPNEFFKTQSYPERDSIELSKLNNSINKLEVLSDIIQRKKITLKRTVSKKDLISSNRDNNDSSHILINSPHDHSISELLDKKYNEKELSEPQQLLDLLGLKNEHINRLYEEIKELKAQIKSQKFELDYLREQLVTRHHLKIKEIKEFSTNKTKNKHEETPPNSGFFLERMNIEEENVFDGFLQKNKLEIVTPFFVLNFAHNPEFTYPPTINLMTSFMLTYQSIQNKAIIISVFLRTSKNIIVSQTFFDGFSKDQSLSFLVEKILRIYSESSVGFLIIETIVSIADTLYKSELRVPIRDWMFFLTVQSLGSHLPFNETMRLMMVRSIQGLKTKEEYQMKILDTLFNHFPQTNSAIILKLRIEGGNPLVLVIEEKQRGIFEVKIGKTGEIEEETVDFLRNWIEEEFFKDYLERKLKYEKQIEF